MARRDRAESRLIEIPFKSMETLLFLLGLIFLIVGAEALVRGASAIATTFGISPLVIGLTVVAFGTSSPELAVSIKAALSDQGSIAVGNVIGSNIFNILLILGLSAVVTPLVVSQQLIRLDIPLLIGMSVLVLAFSLDQQFHRLEGFMLVTALVVYMGFLIYQTRRTPINQEETTPPSSHRNWFQNGVLIIIGLVLLVLGSRWLVDSAVSFANYLGVSELVIGLTIIAAGTSLPELVTSVVASLRGERDIAVGNVIGSNLFNLMGVLGIASIFAPTGITVSTAVTHFDLPVMTAVAFVCLPIFFTGNRISRWEGFILLGYYIAYTLYLILGATHHRTLPAFSNVMLYFVIPLTVLTLLIVTVREWQSQSKSNSS